SPVESLRLLRNRREYRYRYKAFERIPDEILSNIEDSGIRIAQYGDSRQLRDSRFILLEEELEAYPDDGYLQYMYGIELLNRQRFEEGIAHFQKALLNVNYDYLYAPHLLKCLGWSLIYLKRYPEALEVFDEGSKAFPIYSDFLVLKAELYKQLKQYRDAVRELEDSLKIGEQSNIMVPAPEIAASAILELLGEVHEQFFNYRQALACYLQVYKSDSTDKELLYKIVRLAGRTDSADVLEDMLISAVEQNNAEKLILIIDALCRHWEFEMILAHMEQLEPLLGETDLIESIKFYCYLMLGDVQEAELHFSVVSEDRPFYGRILLQWIEYCWLYDKWPEALKLLEEIDRSESIERQVKALYRLINRLFTGEKAYLPILGFQEYEMAGALHENLLRLGQEKKAEILLPLLLKGREDDCRINLAGLILYCGHIKTARKLMELGEPQTLGVLEHILWSNSFMEKIGEYIGRVYGETENGDLALPSALHPPDKPGKALLDFYEFLAASGGNTDVTCTGSSDAEMTCTEIHAEIGRFYEKAQKRTEAFSAYLRALQWDPQNEPVLQRINEIFQEDTSFFNTFLEGKEWTPEGSLFHHRKEFILYIHGFIYFINHQFEEALTYFSKVMAEDTGYYIARAYIIGSLLLLGREEETGNRLNKQEDIDYTVPLLFSICKTYARCRLDEGYRQYPQSELIMEEKERIRQSVIEVLYDNGE
ncbi:MAG: tetratricopeptide repeat protein, partial [Ruminiclostridium sp.]|nr:tetratricopeptide repeat protein [Ruminiclostridium sp.]